MAKSRRALPDSYFDTISTPSENPTLTTDLAQNNITIPQQHNATEPPPTPPIATQPPPIPEDLKKAGPSKERVNIYLRQDLHERARWATLNLPESPRSISQLIEEALQRELERLELVAGRKVERHTLPLTGGRPRQR